MAGLEPFGMKQRPEQFALPFAELKALVALWRSKQLAYVQGDLSELFDVVHLYPRHGDR
jgi:hypothetical protein